MASLRQVVSFGKDTPDPQVKKLDDLYKQARASRRLLEPNWLMDLAYYQGNQWLSFAGDRLQKPDLDENRITVVENRILGAVRTELAKMTKIRPVFTVTPNTGADTDINAAELGERMMRYLWTHLGMGPLALKGLEWSRVCATGFLKCYWDSTIGEPHPVLVGPDGNIFTDQNGKPFPGDPDLAASLNGQLPEDGQVQVKVVRQGDIKVEVRSPFQMFIDPICDTFDDAEWLIEESVKSEEYVLRRYGVKMKGDTNANPGMVEARLLGTPGVTGGVSPYKGVKIREYWCKPSTDYPQGCRTVWAQGQILEQDEKPFDPMPYVMFTGVPVPGRLYGMSVVDALRGPQTELNKVRSQMAENRNRIGNPTLLASKQAIRDRAAFLERVGQTGGVEFFDDMSGPNPVPKWLEAPALPEFVVQEVELIGNAFEDISGQHEVTNANVPPGVTAASAIVLLQEADDTRLGLAMTDYEENLGKFGRKLLKLVGNFYTDNRVIRIAGDDKAWEIFDFKGEQLRGNTHVEVEAGSSFPQSKAAKMAQIQDLMTYFVQSGNPPHGRQLAQFLRDAGMGATDRLVEEYSDSESQINRENVALAMGADLPINDYDDDQEHIDGHVRMQRSPRYATFNPLIQRNIELHVAAHRARQSAQQQQALAMQMQAEGQPSPDMQAAVQQAGLQGQLAQQQQQAQAAGQQQGFQAASSEQQQRQAEEQHQQEMRHREELHQAKLKQMSQQNNQGGQSGRRAA